MGGGVVFERKYAPEGPAMLFDFSWQTLTRHAQASKNKENKA